MWFMVRTSFILTFEAGLIILFEFNLNFPLRIALEGQTSALVKTSIPEPSV